MQLCDMNLKKGDRVKYIGSEGPIYTVVCPLPDFYMVYTNICGELKVSQALTEGNGNWQRVSLTLEDIL